MRRPRRWSWTKRQRVRRRCACPRCVWGAHQLPVLCGALGCHARACRCAAARLEGLPARGLPLLGERGARRLISCAHPPVCPPACCRGRADPACLAHPSTPAAAGKALRAELAKMTGRSSVPNIWIGACLLLRCPSICAGVWAECASWGCRGHADELTVVQGQARLLQFCHLSNEGRSPLLPSLPRAAGKNVGGCNDGPGVATLQVWQVALPDLRSPRGSVCCLAACCVLQPVTTDRVLQPLTTAFLLLFIISLLRSPPPGQGRACADAEGGRRALRHGRQAAGGCARRPAWLRGSTDIGWTGFNCIVK